MPVPLRGFEEIQGVFFRGAQHMYGLKGRGQKINPCHGTVALVRMAPISNSSYLKLNYPLIEKSIQAVSGQHLKFQIFCFS